VYVCLYMYMYIYIFKYVCANPWLDAGLAFTDGVYIAFTDGVYPSHKQRNTVLTLAHAQTIFYARN